MRKRGRDQIKVQCWKCLWTTRFPQYMVRTAPPGTAVRMIECTDCNGKDLADHHKWIGRDGTEITGGPVAAETED